MRIFYFKTFNKKLSLNETAFCNLTFGIPEGEATYILGLYVQYI